MRQFQRRESALFGADRANLRLQCAKLRFSGGKGLAGAGERCRVLIHLVDICPVDGSDPAENAVTIVRELEKYSPELAGKPRWLVFNKMDLILEEEAQEVMDRVKAALAYEGPVYQITAISKEGESNDRAAD